MEEDEEDSLSSDVKGARRVGELASAEERSEESHERDELTEEGSPALSLEVSRHKSVNVIREGLRSIESLLTSRSSTARSLGMKRRCEMSPTQENVNPGKKSGCNVLTE